jgi:hypothetical protein
METQTHKHETSTTGKKLFFDALDFLWDYYNRMYTEESNEHFDALHDSLFCQLEPLGHMADSGEITQGDLDEIFQLLNEVKAYYKASQKLIMPNWIYG